MKRDSATNDLSSISDLEPLSRYTPRLRKEVEDYRPIDIIDQLDDVISLALDSDRPQCNAAVTAIVAKAKILGFMDSNKITVNTVSNPEPVQINFVGVKASNEHN